MDHPGSPDGIDRARSSEDQPHGRAWPIIAFALLLVVAYSLPRAAALWGVDYTSPLSFIDMPDHLYNLDLLSKQRTLPDELLEDPYFKINKDMLNLRAPQKWPTGVYHVALPFARLLGPLSLHTPLLTNLLFTLILVGGLLGLGHAMGSLVMGAAAALLALLCPALVAASFYFSLDYPITAMGVMGLWLLHRTEGFRRPLACLGLSLFSALSLWIKPTYPLYLVVPSIVALVLGLRGPRPRARPLLLASASVLVTLLCAAWLLDLSPERVWQLFSAHTLSQHLPAAAIDPFTPAWALAQLWFAVYNFPWPLLLLGLPGLLFLHFLCLSRRQSSAKQPLTEAEGATRRRQAEARVLVLSALWGGYLALTLMINKGERYLEPLYPLFCLASVAWLRPPIPRWLQAFSLSVLALAYAAILVVSHFEPTPWLPEDVGEVAWSCQPGPGEPCFPWKNRPAHPFWYEFTMPSTLHLAALRQNGMDVFCRFDGLIDQVGRWLRAFPSRRPLGVVYLRDPALEPGELPFAWLSVLVAHHARDRFILTPTISGVPDLPPSMLTAPQLLVLHIPRVDPATRYPGLKLLAARTVALPCGRGRVVLRLSLFAGPEPPNRQNP